MLRRFERRLLAPAAVFLMAMTAAAEPAPGPVEGHLLAGHILQSGQPVAGVTMILTTGGGGTFVHTDDTGAYAFFDLLDGDYTITARMPNYGFTPPRRTIHLQDFDVTSLNFEAILIGAAPGNVTGQAPPDTSAPAPTQRPTPPEASKLPTATTTAASAPTVSAPPPSEPRAETPPSAPASVTRGSMPAIAGGEIAGRVTRNGGHAAAGVVVGYNALRRPGVDQKLPATLTDVDGSFTLPALPPAQTGDPQVWIEAHDSISLYCPAQIIPGSVGSTEFTACTPPDPSPIAHRLSGTVTRLGKGVPRVEIHQAFSTREGFTYTQGPIGPPVAYTDENGHWQFSAPSVSARNATSGFFSYLMAVLPGGPQFCPSQVFLPETTVDADNLDFTVCPSSVSSAVLGNTRIAPAPPKGSYADTSLALARGQPVVAWVQDTAGSATVWVSRWNPAKQAWGTPLHAASARTVDDPGRRVSLAAAGDYLGIAYLDRSDALGVHVSMVQSADGGITWQPVPIPNFIAHSTSPALALESDGGAHLAYYYEGDSVPVRRVIYQRRRTTEDFHAVALPLTNILNKDTGWWAQPPVSLALDDNGVASVGYFLGAADHYLQLAFWKPGMPTAVKIADTSRVTLAPEVHLAAVGGHANAVFRLAGDTDANPALWLSGGAYGATWPSPLRLPSNEKEGSVAAAVNVSGDFVYAIAGEPSFVLMRERNGKPEPYPVANADARPTRRLGLALDDERQLYLAYVDEKDGSLMMYRSALPWN